uniref:hypothetical protein n=1 Tax=uncultured Draconibacterium sp. TaxID=1573823 RepID=UPI0032168D5A
MKVYKLFCIVVFLCALALPYDTEAQVRKEVIETYELVPPSQIVWGPCAWLGYDHIPMAGDMEIYHKSTFLFMDNGMYVYHGKGYWKGSIYNKEGVAVPFNLPSMVKLILLPNGMEHRLSIITGSIGGMQMAAVVRINLTGKEPIVSIENITCVCKN